MFAKGLTGLKSHVNMPTLLSRCSSGKIYCSGPCDAKGTEAPSLAFPQNPGVEAPS